MVVDFEINEKYKCVVYDNKVLRDNNCLFLRANEEVAIAGQNFEWMTWIQNVKHSDIMRNDGELFTDGGNLDDDFPNTPDPQVQIQLDNVANV